MPSWRSWSPTMPLPSLQASSVQKQCLFRVTRNADITVDEGMMDHDIDFRDVMSDLLKKRRKLAAVRLQFWPERSAGDRQVPAGEAGRPGGPLLCPDLAAGYRLPVQTGRPHLRRRQPQRHVLPAGQAHAGPGRVRPVHRGPQARCAAGLPIPEHPPVHPHAAARCVRTRTSSPLK